MPRAASRHRQSRRVTTITGNLQRAIKDDRRVRSIAPQLDIEVMEGAHGVAVIVSGEDDEQGVRRISFRDKNGRRLERAVLEGIKDTFLS